MIDRRIDVDPPLKDQYGALLRNSSDEICMKKRDQRTGPIGECELPLIDLGGLMNGDQRKKRECVAAIVKASSEWGFFQVVNHGINQQLLDGMRREQMKVFQMPFEKKASCRLLNDSYRWGNPTATSCKQFSWSEAFHVPLTKISEKACYGEFTSLREVMEQFAASMSKLARLLAGVLAENLGQPRTALDKICNDNTCFLRLNRYPKCDISPDMIGLIPHTDSDFLTILYQDQVGGLQLMKDSKWVAVKPHREALIVNIGDLFQVIFLPKHQKLCAHSYQSWKFQFCWSSVQIDVNAKEFIFTKNLPTSPQPISMWFLLILFRMDRAAPSDLFIQ